MDQETKHRLAIARLCLKYMHWDDNFDPGAMVMDCKRPFGNSIDIAISHDIADEIGFDHDCNEGLTDDQHKYILDLYRDTIDFIQTRCRLTFKGK